MFKEMNNLTPFFKDNYRRINVREYAQLIHVSPATASKILEMYHKENILKREEDKMYIYYFANKEERFFRELLRTYWRQKLEKSGFLDYLRKEFAAPVVILFGSCTKGEVGPHSDIDVAIFTPARKEFDRHPFEKKLKRELQIFTFHSRDAVKNKDLLDNILNGYIILGAW